MLTIASRETLCSTRIRIIVFRIARYMNGVYTVTAYRHGKLPFSFLRPVLKSKLTSYGFVERAMKITVSTTSDQGFDNCYSEYDDTIRWWLVYVPLEDMLVRRNRNAAQYCNCRRLHRQYHFCGGDLWSVKCVSVNGDESKPTYTVASDLALNGKSNLNSLTRRRTQKALLFL